MIDVYHPYKNENDSHHTTRDDDDDEKQQKSRLENIYRFIYCVINTSSQLSLQLHNYNYNELLENFC